MPLKQSKITFLKIIYLLFLIVSIAFVYISGSQRVNVYKIGQILGTLGLTTLALQPLLTSRPKFIERGVGYDRLIRLHSTNAKLMFLFVLAHPLLLFMPTLRLGVPVISIVRSYTLYHWLGVATLFLLLAILVTSIWTRKLKIKYEVWKLLHKLTYLAIVLGFLHSLMLGSDTRAREPLIYWWLVLAALAIFGITRRVYKRNFGQIRYKVVSVSREANSTWTVALSPVKGKLLDYLPGQFTFVTFLSQRLPREEHHFTISSRPGEKRLTLTVKESGDYTSLIGKLRRGDVAILDGPYGAFTNVGEEGPFLFIAGGIGITPIMSMLRVLQKQKKQDQVKLIYAARSYQDTAFRKELAKFAANKWLGLSYVFSEKMPGKEIRIQTFSGHITRKVIKKVAGDAHNYKVFLVGPEPMMDVVTGELVVLGVPKKNIRTERFALK